MARYSPARASVMLVQGHAVAADVDPRPVYGELFGALAARRLDAGVRRPRRPRADRHARGRGGLGRPRLRPGQQRRRARPRADRPPGSARRRGPRRHARRPRRRRSASSTRRRGSTPAARCSGPTCASRRRPRCGPSSPTSWRATTTPSSSPAAGASTSACCRSGRRSARRCTSPTARPTSARRPSCPPSARGGVGAALVDAAFDWCRDHGHRAACLHFATANRLSSSFWPGIGFVPAMAHLRRRLDERILTARPPATGLSRPAGRRRS